MWDTEISMTSLSQYMAAERPDLSESCSFYVPGGVTWLAVQANRILRRSIGANGRGALTTDDERIPPHLVEETPQD